MKVVNRLFLTFISCIALANASNAAVRLPQLVSDGMVLQRNANINIWGWANAGERVIIKFNSKTYKATTNTDGKWAVILPPIKAGGPYTIDIKAGNHIVLHDILVGDVWFCSGQSNMVLPMERVKERYPDEIAGANYPQIRNFFIPTVSDVRRVYNDLPPGKWVGADPLSVLKFGAATWFFAKQLYLKYHVPIGIINSSVGGTPIQAWISEEGLKQVPQYADRLTLLKDTAYLNRLLQVKPVNNASTDQKYDRGLNDARPWYDPAYTPKKWNPFWLPGYWADQGISGLNGVVWFRKEIDLTPSFAGKPAKLFMGRIVDADQVYVNGMLVGGITYQYPPRRYVLPANLLKAGKNIIVVRITNYAGKGGFVPDKPYKLVVDDRVLDLRGDWQYKVGQVFKSMPEADVFSAQNEPSGLYNTMVAPVVNYTVKGFLWYQGETNTGKPAEYNQLLPALISDWRSKWKEGAIPFLYVQLPNFMEAKYSPSESNWAIVREAQLKALSISNTAMAVAIDAGEWNDIHPLDKKDVGERLALAAQKVAYNENIVSSGPVYQSSKIEGTTIVISFNNIGGGMIAKDGGGLQQFAIAGADKKFVWAKAIIDGDKIIVSSDEIASPVYVRYAWADNPQGANLYNEEGLPASPFRTDN